MLSAGSCHQTVGHGCAHAILSRGLDATHSHGGFWAPLPSASSPQSPALWWPAAIPRSQGSTHYRPPHCSLLSPLDGSLLEKATVPTACRST